MEMSMPSSNPTMLASSMSMTFFTSTQTALYSTSWTPSTTGQYAGTCIFLIVLGAIFQILLAARVIRQQRWRKAESKRRLIVVDNSGKKTDITNKNYKGRPWRLSTDIARAALDTITLGVGYLLMIAVMTMNVGYFMSVLGGIFTGSLAFGHFAIPLGN